MALRIFETDPDAAPKERTSYTDDTVGRFHSGTTEVDARGQTIPVSLAEWRVTTGSQAVADAVAQLLGGTPVETDSTSENFIEVLTTADGVQVILDGPDAIKSDMKLWNRSKLVHHCDGVEFLSPDDKAGRPCGCPELFAERKAAAKDFIGPSPSISITFRLADDPELGTFRFQSGSWTLAEVLHQYDNALTKVGGESVATLALELVEYTTKKGRNVSYRKPVLNGIRSYNSAITEGR
jgi:hypothetical protein